MPGLQVSAEEAGRNPGLQ